MADGQIVFEITADGKKAIANVKDVTSAIERETKKWDASVGNASNSMTSNMAKALDINRLKDWGIQAAKALAQFGKEAIDAASDLEEVQNVVDVTFGDNASKIESWAKKAGTQFGLSETQAKRFTSTLGAMMKSAGMSGDEVADMSTELSGLAADMASFYNLDFDTAFQKIRSGISGETEPLKQLGINMSVANLNAFALEKGLTKTFDKMSQAEQTTLRYQYLMQATADAQGDFARTSDGYANSLRMLETNIDRIKTALGKSFIDVATNATGVLNTFIDKLFPDESKKTVLEEFAEIDLDAANKIKDIEATAEKARSVNSVLAEIEKKAKNTKTAAGQMLDEVPSGKTGNIKEISDTLAGIESSASTAKDTLKSIDSDVPVAENSKLSKYKDLADSANGALGWIKANGGEIDDKVPDAETSKLNAYLGKATEAQNVFNGMEAAVGKIDGGITETEKTKLGQYKAVADETSVSVAAIGVVASGIDAKVPDAATSKIAGLAANVSEALKGAEALPGAAEEAAASLPPLDEATGEANEQTRLWLEACKQLVEEIPGLSSIIDTETGAIKGGTQAVDDYIDAWEQLQKYQVLEGAHSQKRAALDAKYSDLPELQLNMAVARRQVRKQKEEVDRLLSEYGYTQGLNEEGKYLINQHPLTEQEKALKAAEEEYNKLVDAEKEATDTYQTQYDAYVEAGQAWDEEEEALKEQREQYDQTAEAAGYWSSAVQESAQAATEAMTAATKAIADYYQETRDKTRSQVDGTVSGFGKIQSAAEAAAEAANELESVKDKFNAGDVSESVVKNAENSQITLENMTKNLESQVAYMEEYKKNLEAARAAGVSEEILAQLSDGSQESAMYLHALAQESGNEQGIKELNDLWKEVNEGKETFTDTLTQQQLAADETYKALVKSAEEAAAGLNVSEDVKASTGASVEAIATTINAKAPLVAEAVTALLAELDRLSGWGVNIDLGSFGSFDFNSEGSSAPGYNPDGSNIHSQEVGLDSVPFTGFIAKLHEGEGVLTAEENRLWRQFKAGGGVDYDQLGGVMRDNVKPGGNVYLDGTTVGKVVSQMQGNSYRSLQRSGWQS